MSNEKGMTLLEVLAASVILTIVTLAFVTLSSSMGVSATRSDDVTQAMVVAESTLNQLRNTLPTAISSEISTYPQERGKFTISVSTPQPVSLGTNSYTFTTTGAIEPDSRIASVSGFVHVNDYSSPQVVVVTVSWK